MKKAVYLIFISILGLLPRPLLPDISHYTADAQPFDFTIVTEEFPPYNYRENGRYMGVSLEMVEATLREAGLDAEIEFHPWARAFLLARKNRNCLIFGMVRNRNRENLFEWAGVISRYTTSFYKLRHRSGIEFSTIGDAQRYRVGATRADIKAEFLEDNGFRNIEYVTSDIQNLQKLIAERIEILLFDDAYMLYILEKEHIDPYSIEKIMTVNELSGDIYAAFSKGSDPKLISTFRQGLSAVKEKGIYIKILERYFMQLPAGLK